MIKTILIATCLLALSITAHAQEIFNRTVLAFIDKHYKKFLLAS